MRVEEFLYDLKLHDRQKMWFKSVFLHIYFNWQDQQIIVQADQKNWKISKYAKYEYLLMTD
jgi:hypothetical protein